MTALSSGTCWIIQLQLIVEKKTNRCFYLLEDWWMVRFFSHSLTQGLHSQGVEALAIAAITHTHNYTHPHTHAHTRAHTCTHTTTNTHLTTTTSTSASTTSNWNNMCFTTDNAVPQFCYLAALSVLRVKLDQVDGRPQKTPLRRKVGAGKRTTAAYEMTHWLLSCLLWGVSHLGLLVSEIFNQLWNC